MTATLTTPVLGEPSPGSAEALVLLAAAGVLPAEAGVEDPRFSANEQKELNEQLRLAHLRGDLRSHLPAGKEGQGYQITPDLVLNRRAGRKQWSYSIDCKEIECQLKARQSYEQQIGIASYSVGAAFWDIRAGRG
jgi:hypothetical protein